MLPWNSSPRFSARSQTSPDGRSSGSTRSADVAALWPWNTATRLHDFLPPRSEHCFIVPLSLTLRRADALAGLPGLEGAAAADPDPPAPPGPVELTTRPTTMSRAVRRMES